jgi:hypothetical protein
MNKRFIDCCATLLILGGFISPAWSQQLLAQQPIFSNSDPYGIVLWLKSQGYMNYLSKDTPLKIAPTQHLNCQSWLNDYRQRGLAYAYAYAPRHSTVRFNPNTAVARLNSNNFGIQLFDVFFRPVYSIENYIVMPLPQWPSINRAEIEMLQDYAKRVFEHELGHILINRRIVEQFNANAPTYHVQVEALSEKEATDKVFDMVNLGVGLPREVFERENAKFYANISQQNKEYDLTSTQGKRI